jgi:hypothetical protein
MMPSLCGAMTGTMTSIMMIITAGSERSVVFFMIFLTENLWKGS